MNKVCFLISLYERNEEGGCALNLAVLVLTARGIVP